MMMMLMMTVVVMMMMTMMVMTMMMMDVGRYAPDEELEELIALDPEEEGFEVYSKSLV
jgi:hypothetical protein